MGEYIAPQVLDILPLRGVFGEYGTNLSKFGVYKEKQSLWPFDRGRRKEIVKKVPIFTDGCVGCFYCFLVPHYMEPRRTWVGASMNNLLKQSLWISYVKTIYRSITTRTIVGYCSAMISGYDHKGWPAMDIGLFKVSIASKESKPDKIIGTGVFSSCGHLGALNPCNWVVSVLIQNHNKLSISSYNNLIFRYSRGESMEEARKAVLKIRDVSYYTLIAGHKLHFPFDRGRGTKIEENPLIEEQGLWPFDRGWGKELEANQLAWLSNVPHTGLR